MEKKVFEVPVVRIANFQNMDVIATSGGDFLKPGEDEVDPFASKTRISTPASAGTIQKSGLTW